MTSLEGIDEIKPNSRTNEWKKGWIIVVSAFFVSFIVDGLIFSFGIMLVEIIDYFGKGRATSSAIVSILSAVQHSVGPLAGALGEKYGHRIIVIIGSLVSCTGFIISSFATSVYHLWISYGFLGGFGLGLMFMPTNVCMLQHFNTHRTLANGITTSGSGIGTFAFTYGLRLLIDRFGWRGTMLLEAGFVLQGIILGLALTDSRTIDTKLEVDNSSSVLSVKSFVASILNLQLLRDAKCCLYLLSTFIIAIAFIVPYTFVPDQVAQTGMSKTQAAMLTSSIGIANTVSRVIFGWIGDHVCFSRLYLLVVLVFLNGLLSGLSPLMSTFETKLLYTILFGTLIGGYVALLAVVLVDMVKPDFTSNAFGLIQLAVGISATVAAPLAGFLFDQTGSYNITFVACGAEFIVGAILLCICHLSRTKN